MKFLTVIVLLSLLAGCFNQVDHTVRPQIDHVAPFYSAQVMPRNVDIWLPRQYNSGVQQRFPVIYMHDGQNLFEHENADLGIAWDIDRIAQRMMDKKQIKPAIIVAIWSSPKREQEYFPDCVTFSNSDETPATCVGGDYLRFIVNELKPYVDKHYRTLPEQQNTMIAGSALGALVSLYAVTEYPDVFGRIAGVSVQWPALLHHSETASVEALTTYLEYKLPAAGEHGFYFDIVTFDIFTSAPRMDKLYKTSVARVLQEKGYVQGRDWVSRKVPGSVYSQNPWNLRADAMLEFLIGH